MFSVDGAILQIKTKDREEMGEEFQLSDPETVKQRGP